jgi:hypothetical protein
MVVFGAILFALAVLVVINRPSRKKTCVWRATGGGSGALAEYECKTCGVVAFSTDPLGPKDCKRGFDRGRL